MADMCFCRRLKYFVISVILAGTHSLHTNESIPKYVYANSSISLPGKVEQEDYNALKSKATAKGIVRPVFKVLVL